MDTQPLQIHLAKRILDLSDEKLLQKVAHLLDNEQIVGYDVKTGNPVYAKEFANEIEADLKLFRKGKLETTPNDKVFERILNK